eukprot:7379543-Pyramimonas_sp.AAC.1
MPGVAIIASVDVNPSCVRVACVRIFRKRSLPSLTEIPTSHLHSCPFRGHLSGSLMRVASR